MPARERVSGENGLTRIAGRSAEPLERAADGPGDVTEANRPVEEARDGRLVGCVEHRRRRATGTPRLDAQRQGGKGILPYGLERQW